MKKNKLFFVSMLLCSSIMFSSCIGSFSLFGKLNNWNQNVSGEKFVNELVFLAFWIVPVYEIAILADALVLNTVEFWSGSNPVAARVGDIKEIQGEKGYYAIKTKRNGYSITNKTTDTKFDLVFNSKSKTWSVKSGDKTADLIHINDNGTIDITLQNGETINVCQTEEGLSLARQAVMGDFFAKR